MAHKRVTDKQLLTAIDTLTGDLRPTREEIGKMVGMCKAGVHNRLKQLEEKGLVKNTNVIRGTSLTEEGKVMLNEL